MTLERQNPVPIGRYWLDVFGANVDALQRHFREHAGAAFVQQTEEDTAGPNGTWFLFKVLEPLPWDARRFGYPTIAGASIRYRDDTTSEREPDLNPVERVEAMIRDAEKAAAKTAGTVDESAAKIGDTAEQVGTTVDQVGAAVAGAAGELVTVAKVAGFALVALLGVFVLRGGPRR